MPFANRAVVLCDTAPVFEYRAGMFYGRFQSGDAVEERAFTPDAFLRSLRYAQAAANAYFAERERGESNVVSLGH